MAAKSPTSSPSPHHGRRIADAFENAEEVADDSAPLLRDGDGEEIERTDSWSQKPATKGFIWIQTGQCASASLRDLQSTSPFNQTVLTEVRSYLL
jgi:hypothetical protein